MPDQPLTRPQAAAILIMHYFGSSVVIGIGTGVGQDAWIALILGVLFTVPALLVYARIAALNPNEGLFTAAEHALGRIFGKVLTALMSWYALHLCALVLRDFSEFIQLTSLHETPQLPVLIIMAVTVYMLARSGGKALGKWSLAALPIVLGIVSLTMLFSFDIMEPRNFLPILEHPPKAILTSAFLAFSFPFAETVLHLSIADFVRPGDNPRRIYLTALFIGSSVLMLVVIRNLMILGPSVVSVEYFPSYSATRIIRLGGFLSRIEGVVSINFILGGITKLTICLIAATRGVAYIFGIRDWRTLVAPVGLMALAMAQTQYRSTMEMFKFISYYPYYTIPFQIALPLILWVASEIRARRARRPEGAANAPSPAPGRGN